MISTRRRRSKKDSRYLQCKIHKAGGKKTSSELGSNAGRARRRVEDSQSMLFHQGPDRQQGSEEKDVLDNHCEDASVEQDVRSAKVSERKKRKERAMQTHISERVVDAKGRSVSCRVWTAKIVEYICVSVGKVTSGVEEAVSDVFLRATNGSDAIESRKQKANSQSRSQCRKGRP